MVELKKWQIIYIDNIKYTVVNMVEYKEDTWKWKEYELREDNGAVKWLEIEEKEQGEIKYSIYTKYMGTINEEEMFIEKGGITYELEEKGYAKVTNYFGDADVDMFEVCEYFDYLSEDKTKIISIQKWEDETEVTQGEYIDISRIRITQEKDQKITKSKNKMKIITMIIYGIIFIPILAQLIPLISGMFVNKSIEKYLEKGTNYEYITSITNNVNNQKAKVYKSKLKTVDETVKNIIDGVPEGITQTTDADPNTEKDGIGLLTNKEYAYVYEENGEIYVQISSKKYAEDSTSTMYHSTHRNYYHSTYLSRRNHYLYTNYLSSARQQSVTSRVSSGGGTSSGK